MNKECKSCGTENYHEFLSCEWCGKAMMETRNDLEYANSQPNENELEKERLVTIKN